MKIVLDTNCLVVAIPKKSPYRWLWESFRAGKFKLCITTEILEEYHEILSKWYSEAIAANVVAEILNSPNIVLCTVYYKWGLIKADYDDNKFSDCAANSNAKFIVTNDKHFNILNKIDFPKIEVLSIAEFKKTMFKK
jgi:putative PIN family toxin of toxin-antitoxin system